MKTSPARRRPTDPSLVLEHDARLKKLRVEIRGWPVAIITSLFTIATIIGVVWKLVH
jgi:hypothetical protein